MLLTKIQLVNKEVQLLFPTLSMCLILIENEISNFKKSL